MGFALRGIEMSIDVNEGEINIDMKGRRFSSLAQSRDTRLGRRGQS